MNNRLVKDECFVTAHGVTVRIRRVVTGGYRAKNGKDQNRWIEGMGTHCVPKLSRYEITHNGRYLWSDTNWERVRKHAKAFAIRIANQRKGATDGE